MVRLAELLVENRLVFWAVADWHWSRRPATKPYATTNLASRLLLAGMRPVIAHLEG